MKRVLLAYVALLVAGRIEAQVVTEMTRERIREAIAAGRGGLEPRFKAYELRTMPGPGLAGEAQAKARPIVATVTTPFLRVMLAAHEAKSVYKDFSAKDVTPEMVAPEAVIVASAFPLQRSVISIKAVVIALPDGRVVQPDRSEELPATFSNAFGATSTGTGRVARFPLSAIQEGAEVRVVLHNGVELKARFNLDDVR